MKKEDLLNLLINGADSFSIEMIIFNLVVTTLLALFIYVIYKKTFVGVLYSQNFNVTIMMIAVITAIVMMLIGSNLAISLGMVGALSIVRFRAAIKEPRDIAFLFWAITVGLAAGTGAFMIAIIGSIFVALILIVFSKTIHIDCSYLLIIKGADIQAQVINDLLKEYRIPFKLKMRTTSMVLTEITYEITLKTMNEEQLIKELKTFEAIESIHIVSYNGEISG